MILASENMGFEDTRRLEIRDIDEGGMLSADIGSVKVYLAVKTGNPPAGGWAGK
jgi:hypothetical protein